MDGAKKTSRGRRPIEAGNRTITSVGGRINNMLNTHGYYYEGLWRKSVLICVARVAISAQSYQ